jgi:nucleoside-diphosphate kinase
MNCTSAKPACDSPAASRQYRWRARPVPLNHYCPLRPSLILHGSYARIGGEPASARLASVARCRYKAPSFQLDLTLKDHLMALERTFSIIKPDAVRRNLIGQVLAKFEAAGLRPIALKKIHMTRAQAEGFYAVHKDRPFYGELVEQMIASPVVVQVLEGEGAILKNREVMGATNPEQAAEGTIRKEFALSIGENSVHGSDAPETAAEEIKFFFNDDEIVG